jgi:hypothetical protein
MNREAIKQDFLSALETGKVQKTLSEKSEAESYARARERFATLWAAVKAWDEAIRDRTEGASVRYLFEKVSRDGVITGRISASQPGRAALNIAFQIQGREMATKIGIERRIDLAKEQGQLMAVIQKAVVDYFV